MTNVSAVRPWYAGIRTMSARTSISHPLRIESVGVAGGGELGMTLSPGRRARLFAHGAWERSLQTDFDAVLAW